MKPIIFILSCGAYRTSGHNQAIRETWAGEWGNLIPHKFLLGRGCTDPLDDELIFDEDDSRSNAMYKCREAQRWSNDHGYSHMFLCCSDTYVAVPRLLASGFENYDCVGSMLTDAPFPGGGCGYWLSARANDAMFCDNLSRYEGLEKENHDLWAGRALAAAGIPLQNDARYWTNGGFAGLFPYWEKTVWDTGIVAVHLGQCPEPGVYPTYTPEDMRKCHQSFLENAK